MVACSLDARSLALFRVLMAGWILLDLWRRVSNHSIAWHTSTGTDPPPLLPATQTRHGLWLHQLWFYRGSVELQYALFAAHAGVVAAWGLGVLVPTRVLTPLVWAFSASVHARNDYIGSGGYYTATHFLFWAMFLPLDACFTTRGTWWPQPTALVAAVTKRRTTATLTSTSVVGTAASAAFCLQILCQYWTIVGLRFFGTTWMPPQLDAVHYALLSSSFATDYARDLVLALPTFVPLMTASAMLLETVGPLCIVAGSAALTAPVWLQRSRLAGVAIVVLGVSCR